MTNSLKRPLNPLNLSPASLLSFLPWLALLGLALQRRLVPDRRRLHQLPLHPQPPRRSRPGLQPGRIRRGLHQLPLDPGTGRHLGNLRPAPGARRSLALRRLHRRHHRRHVMVGRPPALAAKPGPGRLDGAGAGLQQRHLCRLDIGRRTGNKRQFTFFIVVSGRPASCLSRQESLQACWPPR